LDDIDAVAVTQGPGLAGSLVVGLNFAKGICLAKNFPLLGINHLEGHIYSSWVYPQEMANPPREPKFPLLAVLVSGGHTELDIMDGHHQYKKLGGTTDDAAGEAFDKVARLLKLPYPGGPSIQKVAEKGDPSAFAFTRAKTDGKWDFSFSGIKTAVLREIKKLEAAGLPVPVENLAASFQAAVVDMLFSKAMNAVQDYKVKEIVLAGGVSANHALRSAFTSQKEFPVHIPALTLCTDNAAMIAAAAYYRFIDGQKGTFDMDVLPTWILSQVNPATFRLENHQINGRSNRIRRVHFDRSFDKRRQRRIFQTC